MSFSIDMVRDPRLSIGLGLAVFLALRGLILQKEEAYRVWNAKQQSQIWAPPVARDIPQVDHQQVFAPSAEMSASESNSLRVEVEVEAETETAAPVANEHQQTEKSESVDVPSVSVDSAQSPVLKQSQDQSQIQSQDDSAPAMASSDDSKSLRGADAGVALKGMTNEQLCLDFVESDSPSFQVEKSI